MKRRMQRCQNHLVNPFRDSNYHNLSQALQRSKLSRMTESDFMGDDDDEDAEEDNSDDDNLEAQSKQGRKHRDKVTSDLETLVLGNQVAALKSIFSWPFSLWYFPTHLVFAKELGY